MAVAKESIRPDTVDPSFAVVMNISPGSPVLVKPDRQIPFVSAYVEVVDYRFTLVGIYLTQVTPRCSMAGHGGLSPKSGRI